jgi:hypothetical protein
MALRKLKWLKYLFIGRSEAETEQNYWNEKRKKHIASEHSAGIVQGLGVTATDPPSLSVLIAAGRAVDPNGDDPEIESVQTLDCSSLVPATGNRTIYITLQYNATEVEPYFVNELGGYQNKYVQDSYILQVTPNFPVAPEIELARIQLSAGVTAITNPPNPAIPGQNQIDSRYRKYTGKEITALGDLSDVDENEAAAFNAMNSPSASNPVSTILDVDSRVNPVKSEVQTARGSKSSLDSRLDVVLNEDGTFKGITQITPSAPLTGGGNAGNIPVGIDDATPSARGAMSAADKAKLDGIEPGATADLTAAEILTLLKTVDGAGSGLDADLLDGQQHRGVGGAEHPAVTTGVNGFMSSTDKTKLDGVESGATADMTAAEILAAVKTVDGPGSGLDADLLDGYQASHFLGLAQVKKAWGIAYTGAHINFQTGVVENASGSYHGDIGFTQIPAFIIANFYGYGQSNTDHHGWEVEYLNLASTGVDVRGSAYGMGWPILYWLAVGY